MSCIVLSLLACIRIGEKVVNCNSEFLQDTSPDATSSDDYIRFVLQVAVNTLSVKLSETSHVKSKLLLASR